MGGLTFRNILPQRELLGQETSEYSHSFSCSLLKRGGRREGGRAGGREKERERERSR